MTHLRNNIEWLLSQTGLSQNQLAKCAGVTQSRLNRALTETSHPRFDLVRQISEVFGIPPGDMLIRDLRDHPVPLPSKVDLLSKMPHGRAPRPGEALPGATVGENPQPGAEPVFNVQMVRDGITASGSVDQTLAVAKLLADEFEQVGEHVDPRRYLEVLELALKGPKDDPEFIRALVRLIARKP